MTEPTGIRDPIYGDITLTKAERRVLDTQPVQRLRRIKQLGLSSLVYPGATHTRFEHSLGVMHIAGKLAEQLGLDDTQVTEARMAGLLHDAGHGPYSHASEVVTEQSHVPHEELSCEVVDELSGKIPADAERVKDYIRGDADVNIVAGVVDADRIDYLRRDSDATGLEYGTIDIETLIKFAGLVDGDFVFNEKAVQTLEGFLTARFHMIRSVYYHHASQIAETMLQRALEQYVEEHGHEQLREIDDYEMHHALRNATDPARYLYERIINRNLYKRSLIIGQETLSRDELATLSDVGDARGLEERIARKANVDPTHVVVNLPATPSQKPYDIDIQHDGSVKPLREVTPIPEALREAEWRVAEMAVYTPKSEVDGVNSSAEEVVYDVLDEH